MKAGVASARDRRDPRAPFTHWTPTRFRLFENGIAPEYLNRNQEE